MLPKVIKLQFLFNNKKNHAFEFEQSSIDFEQSSIEFEQGSILILTLLMLIAMTAIGVAVFDIIGTAQKITSNVQNNMYATVANDYIRMVQAQNLHNANYSIWSQYPQLQIAPQDQSSTWWASSGRTYGSPPIPFVASQPQFFVETFACSETSQSSIYRLTVRSVGATSAVTNISTLYIESKTPKPAIVLLNNTATYTCGNWTNTGAWNNANLSANITATGSGFITQLYFLSCGNCGTGSCGYNGFGNFTVALSSPGYPNYYEQFPQAWQSYSYFAAGGFTNTGVITLSVPYWVDNGKVVTVNVSGFSCPFIYGAMSGPSCVPDKLYVEAGGIPGRCQ